MTASDPPLVTSRRIFLTGGALAAASAAAFALRPARAEHRIGTARLDDLIPATIGPWRFFTRDGVVLPQLDGPSEGYDQVVSRTYEAPGLPPVMLAIAYGSTQGGSLQLHRPEVCYPSQGFRLSGTSLPQIDVGLSSALPSRAFTARRDDRVEQVLYWSRISERFPRTSAEEYLAILGAVLRGAVPDGVLVRFSTIDADAAQSRAILAGFARGLLDAAPPRARAILVGDIISSAISRTAAGHRG